MFLVKFDWPSLQRSCRSTDIAGNLFRFGTFTAILMLKRKIINASRYDFIIVLGRDVEDNAECWSNIWILSTRRCEKTDKGPSEQSEDAIHPSGCTAISSCWDALPCILRPSTKLYKVLQICLTWFFLSRAHTISHSKVFQCFLLQILMIHILLLKLFETFAQLICRWWKCTSKQNAATVWSLLNMISYLLLNVITLQNFVKSVAIYAREWKWICEESLLA